MLFRRLRRRNRQPNTAVNAVAQQEEEQQHQELVEQVEQLLSSSLACSDGVIDSLLHLRLRQVDKNSETCHVCCEDHQVGNVVTTLPCGHMYHSECIVQWLGRCGTCPICRKEVTADNASHATEEESVLDRKMKKVMQQGDDMAIVTRALLFHHDQLKGYDQTANAAFQTLTSCETSSSSSVCQEEYEEEDDILDFLR